MIILKAHLKNLFVFAIQANFRYSLWEENLSPNLKKPEVLEIKIDKILKTSEVKKGTEVLKHQMHSKNETKPKEY